MCVDVNKVLSYSIKAALRQSTCTVLIRVNGFECARLIGTKESEGTTIRSETMYTATTTTTTTTTTTEHWVYIIS